MLALDTDIVLHEEPGIHIALRPRASEQFVRLIEDIEFGGDGLRYRRLRVSEQIARLERPAFVELRVDGELAGTYALSARRVRFGERRAVGVYRGLLTVQPDVRGRGLGRQLVGHAFRWLSAEALRSGEPTISWGCIEASNSRSRVLLESHGAQRLGSLDSLLVYRQWPRARIGFDALSPEDGRVVHALAEHGDAGLCAEPGAAAQYYAVVRDGNVVAGARATVTRIDLSGAVGAYGAFHERVGRLIPAVRRRFDPGDFTYLRLSDVVARPGSAHLWRDLLPALMREHGVHMAMFVLDPRSATYRSLADAAMFGRFAQKTRARLDVLATAWNLPDNVMDLLSRQPLGIGPLDV